jgi:GntR family transcriptional regulator
VRELAAEAGVNPNTVQRALAELEGTGLLHTQRTAGRFVTEDLSVIQSAKEKLARGRTREYLSSMAQLGYSRQQVKALLDTWEEE